MCSVINASGMSRTCATTLLGKAFIRFDATPHLAAFLRRF
jgi:hypothetical protein